MKPFCCHHGICIQLDNVNQIAANEPANEYSIQKVIPRGYDGEVLFMQDSVGVRQVSFSDPCFVLALEA